jgi:hypothetical protein
VRGAVAVGGFQVKVWTQLSIARRLQPTGVATVLLLSVLLVTTAWTITQARRQQELALLFQQSATQLQLMLRGVNEAAITQGASGFIKTGLAGIDGFNRIYDQLLTLASSTPL